MNASGRLVYSFAFCSHYVAVTKSINHTRNKPYEKQTLDCPQKDETSLTTYISTLSAKATYAAIAKTYAYLTPDLWKETLFTKSPYQEYSDYLQKNHRPVGTQKQEIKQY